MEITSRMYDAVRKQELFHSAAECNSLPSCKHTRCLSGLFDAVPNFNQLKTPTWAELRAAPFFFVVFFFFFSSSSSCRGRGVFWEPSRLWLPGTFSALEVDKIQPSPSFPLRNIRGNITKGTDRWAVKVEPTFCPSFTGFCSGLMRPGVAPSSVSASNQWLSNDFTWEEMPGQER